ncbi:MAG: hypothetical protein NT023_02630 [Armatimonadetes bacterium]|nr:hypothetical protein [Armatimonadota bacterium]
MSNPTTRTIPNEIPELITKLKSQRKKRKLAHHFVGTLLYGAIGIAIFSNMAWVMLLGAIFTLLLLSAIVLQHLTESEMTTLERICWYEDTRSVSILMDTFFEQEFPAVMFTTVVKALNGILPKITFEDKKMFTPRHVELLHALFLQYHDTRMCNAFIAKNHISQRFKTPLSEVLCHSLRVRALRTLVQIGDEKTARVLKRFIQGTCRSSIQLSLQKLAITALIELEKWLNREGEAQTLLRASSPNDDFLLRPSYATATEPPEMLLRPIQSDTESEHH